MNGGVYFHNKGAVTYNATNTINNGPSTPLEQDSNEIAIHNIKTLRAEKLRKYLDLHSLSSTGTKNELIAKVYAFKLGVRLTDRFIRRTTMLLGMTKTELDRMATDEDLERDGSMQSEIIYAFLRRDFGDRDQDENSHSDDRDGAGQRSRRNEDYGGPRPRRNYQSDRQRKDADDDLNNRSENYGSRRERRHDQAGCQRRDVDDDSDDRNEDYGGRRPRRDEQAGQRSRRDADEENRPPKRDNQAGWRSRSDVEDDSDEDGNDNDSQPFWGGGGRQQRMNDDANMQSRYKNDFDEGQRPGRNENDDHNERREPRPDNIAGSQSRYNNDHSEDRRQRRNDKNDKQQRMDNNHRVWRLRAESPSYRHSLENQTPPSTPPPQIQTSYRHFIPRPIPQAQCSCTCTTCTCSRVPPAPSIELRPVPDFRFRESPRVREGGNTNHNYIAPVPTHSSRVREFLRNQTTPVPQPFNDEKQFQPQQSQCCREQDNPAPPPPSPPSSLLQSQLQVVSRLQELNNDFQYRFGIMNAVLRGNRNFEGDYKGKDQRLRERIGKIGILGGLLEREIEKGVMIKEGMKVKE